MNYEIKQLSQNSKIFFPQTTAEAVVVKQGAEVLTLDKVLNRKIETISTPENSGLQSSKSGNNVIISHNNNITPNELTQSLSIKYDSTGHIIETKPTSKIIVLVLDQKLLEYNGSEDQNIIFSDSFKIDNNKIEINWNEISNGNT